MLRHYMHIKYSLTFTAVYHPMSGVTIRRLISS